MRLIFAIMMALFVTACEQDPPVVNITNTLPTAPTVVPKDDIIEFRVTGTYSTATIRVSNSMDGLIQLTTGLPYSTMIQSNLDLIFLSLEAYIPPTATMTSTNTYNGFLQVQILINGVVFREANSSNFNPTLNVSGTYRKRVSVSSQAVMGNGSK